MHIQTSGGQDGRDHRHRLGGPTPSVRHQVGPLLLREHYFLGFIRHPAEPRFNLHGPKMRRHEQDRHEDGYGHEKRWVSRQWVSQHDGIVFLDILENLSMEQHPREDATHERAMQEVEREADFPQP